MKGRAYLRRKITARIVRMSKYCCEMEVFFTASQLLKIARCAAATAKSYVFLRGLPRFVSVCRFLHAMNVNSDIYIIY